MPDQKAIWRSIRSRLFLIAGPCVIESEQLCFKVAEALQKACEREKVAFIFKASFDKANRSSGKSFRGPGISAGLKTLEAVQKRFGCATLTDVHTAEQVEAAAASVDILQIPAFLCRQTDLIEAAVQTGRIVNIKKGQFLSPHEMTSVTSKATAAGGKYLLLTERGTTFGYNNLVADMRSIPIMARLGFPIVFDATHSVQLPGAAGDKSGGQREFAPVLARAAIAVGAQGIFMETHPDPERGLSDGPNMIPLKQMPKIIADLARLHAVVKGLS